VCAAEPVDEGDGQGISLVEFLDVAADLFSVDDHRSSLAVSGCRASFPGDYPKHQ
jgi:hypothetical protein